MQLTLNDFPATEFQIHMGTVSLHFENQQSLVVGDFCSGLDFRLHLITSTSFFLQNTNSYLQSENIFKFCLTIQLYGNMIFKDMENKMIHLVH